MTEYDNVVAADLQELANALTTARGGKLVMVELGEVIANTPGISRTAFSNISGPGDMLVALTVFVKAVEAAFQQNAPGFSGDHAFQAALVDLARINEMLAAGPYAVKVDILPTPSVERNTLQ